MSTHAIEMKVVDEPGVITRITGLFSRRAFNIDTITVGKTQTEGISKIVFTLTTNEETHIHQVQRQCEKLIDVIEVRELPLSSSAIREMCLVKVAFKNPDEAKEIEKFAKSHRFEVIYKNGKHLVIEMMAESEKIEIFLEQMKRFGIIDISRTGVTGISLD